MTKNPSDKKYSKADLEEAVQHAISRRDVKEIKDGMESLKKDFKDLSCKIDDNYIPRTEFKESLDGLSKQLSDTVRREEFVPVRNAMYGLIALLVTAVIIAIVNGVLVR